MSTKTKKTAPEADAPTAAQFPTLSIIERRIQSGSRNLTRPMQVALIGQPEPMVTRTVNTAIDSRWHQVTTELGWVPVMPSEVAGGLQGDMKVADGRVVMGEHGREVLVKMPRRLFEAIQRSRAQKEHRAMTSKARFKQRVAESFERDAKDADRAGAESLERASELMTGDSRIASVNVEQFEVSHEMVPIER